MSRFGLFRHPKPSDMVPNHLGFRVLGFGVFGFEKDIANTVGMLWAWCQGG